MDRERARLLASARSGMFGEYVQHWANLTTGQGFKLRNLTEDGQTVTELFIYDAIGGWFGISAQDVVRELMSIDTEQINVRINSPGGDVFDGIAIANALRSHSAKITVTIDSLCASIATAIAMAGETVTMMPGSQMMIHNASGMAMGQAADMRKLADVLDFQSKNIATQYARRAGGTVDEWQAAMDAETWLSDDEAVAAGLADSVAVVKQGGPAAVPGPEQGAEWDAWDLSGFKFAGRADAPAPMVAHAKPAGPVRCQCHPTGVATSDALLNLTHSDPCPLFEDAKKPPAIKPLKVKWDFVTHPKDSEAGTCDECEDLAADSPYSEDDFPEIPVHPNCECTKEPASVTYDDQAMDPIVLHFQTELAADNTVRQAMKEALV